MGIFLALFLLFITPFRGTDILPRICHQLNLISQAKYEEGDFITSSKVSLHYYFYDRNTDSVLVHFHGGPGSNSSVFRKSIGTKLANHIGSVLYIDQRGSGLSQRKGFPVSSYNFIQATRDMHEAIHGILGDKKIVILGVSFGGALALKYALAYPKHAQAYIFSSPYFGFQAKHNSFSSFEDIKINSPEFSLANKLNTQDHGDISMYWHKNEHIWSHNYLPLLAKITKPILIVSGENDIVIGKDILRHAKPYVSRGTFVSIPDAGHKPYFFHTVEYIKTLKDFVEKVFPQKRTAEECWKVLSWKRLIK